MLPAQEAYDTNQSLQWVINVGFDDLQSKYNPEEAMECLENAIVPDTAIKALETTVKKIREAKKVLDGED